MKILRKSIRLIALTLAAELLGSVLWPTAVWALTAGPSSPEFSSFTPVATTDMVDLFTGNFNYNLPVIAIPGAEGAGYALSLAYNSGVTSEQEASWTGFGWSLNPGAINRSVRGIPDDYDGSTVDYYNKTRPNWSVNMGHNAGVEAFSKDASVIGGLSLSNSLRFNNHQGYYKNVGVGINGKGIASLNVNVDNDGVQFSANINPTSLLKMKQKPILELSARMSAFDPEEKNKKGKSNTVNAKAVTRGSLAGILQATANASLYGFNNFEETVRPTTFTKYAGIAYNWSVSTQFNPGIPVGLQRGFLGGFNVQFNQYKNPRPAYGYLHSDHAGTSGVMDYYMEKSTPFDKRDYYLGMPFNNHDIFHLSGEGLSGGFRAYNSRIGHYAPNEAESTIKVRQTGFEVMVGQNLGIGLDLGVGSQKTTVDSWNVTNRGNFANSSTRANQPFRFNADPGGTVSYTDNTALETGQVKLTNPVYGFRNARAIAPVADAGRSGTFQLGNTGGRSSFINPQYHSGKLEGFTIVNENGLKYTYNEPVYVRNTTHLSVDIAPTDQKEWRYLAFRTLKLSTDASGGYTIPDAELNSDAFRTAVGNINKDEYVSTFLMTSICTPEYLDRTGDGPSHDDFGGWTKFNYRKIYGKGKSTWYRYRTPYNGLLYQANALSDTKDDIGSLTTGEKEVPYLSSIETNTHIAYFVTNKSVAAVPALNGTGTDRKDGLGAPAVGTDDPAATHSTDGIPHQGNTPLEYLEKIVLYPKDKNGVPLHDTPVKTVHFAYDYSLEPNVPNNIHSTYTFADNTPNNLASGTGKLTLRKVWFEYGGVIPARISPYQFDYTYKHSGEAGSDVARHFAPYDDLADDVQNPMYAPHLLGPWGYPMANGKKRKQNDIPWIDQSYYFGDQKDFDPAAWHLKSVKLPSGGEIVIQYEEKDYTRVQDREAMAMARLTGDGTARSYAGQPQYTVIPEDLGASSEDPDQVRRLAGKINTYFAGRQGNPEKLYFKFLYALKGSNPSLSDCRSEYLTGYTTFKEAVAGTQGGKNVIFITLQGGSGEKNPVPRRGCYELVSNQKQGKLDNNDCTDPEYEARYDEAMATAADRSQASLSDGEIKSVARDAMQRMAGDPRSKSYQTDKKEDVCRIFSPDHSFFKLPMLRAKKGGGVRVKKLLMYDQGLETGDEAVYGTEYLYVQEDGTTSSGIATNEPGAAREENPLVTFLPKKDQTAFSRLTVGTDREQTEGPLGESLLPAASVGHARVVTRNIHSGNTGTGFSVTEFHTAGDYPFDRYYGPVAGEAEGKYDVTGRGINHTPLDDNREKDYINIPAGLFNYSTSKVWAAQGYRFIINNMHGQMKKTAQYGGTYTNSIADGYEVASAAYTYYEPGEKIKMMDWDATAGTFKEYYDTPGKETDMAMEARRLRDTSLDFTIELDISITISFLPPIFVTVMPSFTHQTKEIATHATTKVLRYPAILKSITSSRDGIVNTTENLAFNAATGKPVLTRTTDGFHNLQLAGSPETHDGSVYQLRVPASWPYGGMGQKAANPANTNQLNAEAAAFTAYGAEPDPAWLLSPVRLLSASVQTFSKDWSSSWADPRIDGQYTTDAHRTALNQVWRPQATWAYQADEEASSPDKKIYQSGYFDITAPFDRSTGTRQADNNWIKTSETVKYSPHGSALEEKNVLDIPSAALFGEQYGNHLPIMVAQNADYHTLYFQDFENDAAYSTARAHSGRQSKPLTHGENLVAGLTVTPRLTHEGGLFFAWLHFDSEATEPGLRLRVNSTTLPLEEVARTGEWTLFKTPIDQSIFTGIGAGNAITAAIISESGSFSQPVTVDDIRFQPLDAEATCYVYNPANFRLITQFDSEHFGLFYQHNEEGKLVRKQLETERGLKTVQETQYNTVKTTRP